MTKPLPTVKWLAAQHSPGEGQWKDGGTEWTQDGVSSVKLTANGLGNWRLGGRAWKRAVWPSPHTCLSLETSVPPVGSICELVRKLTFPWSHGAEPSPLWIVIPSVWRRECLPTPVFLPGEFHGQRRLVDYSPWGHTESDTTEQLTHTHIPSVAQWSPHIPLWGLFSMSSVLLL